MLKFTPKSAKREKGGARPNVPARHYAADDVIELADRGRPASFRAAVAGINVPAAGESWEDLNRWRERWGLAPASRPQD
jgi:hypothetical protein